MDADFKLPKSLSFIRNLQVSLKSPQFLLATYRRQGLEEYFGRLLAELDVDDELSLKAVQEALDLESNLIDVRDYLFLNFTILFLALTSKTTTKIDSSRDERTLPKNSMG